MGKGKLNYIFNIESVNIELHICIHIRFCHAILLCLANPLQLFMSVHLWHNAVPTVFEAQNNHYKLYIPFLFLAYFSDLDSSLDIAVAVNDIILQLWFKLICLI